MTGAGNRDWLVLASLITAGVVASMGASFAPFMVGALVEHAGLSVKQAGAVASVEMAGAMLGAFAIFHVVNRLERRSLILGGALLFAIGNLAAAFAEGFPALLIVRALCGFVSAIVVATVAASIATRERAERAYGLFFLTMIVSGALCSLVIPGIITAGGARGFFLALAGISTLSFVAGFLIPASKKNAAGNSSVGGSVFDAKQVQALACMFLWFVAFGATWTFVERLGAGIPLTATAIGLALAISMGGGASGALAASLVGGRYGAFKPIALAATASAIAGAAMIGSNSVATFAVAVLVYKFGFSLAMPYISAIFAGIDKSGRLMALGTLMQAAGLAVGPAVGSAIVSENTVAPAIYFSIVIGVAAGLIGIRLARFVDMRSAPLSKVVGAGEPLHG